jgi:hypothetical protein
MSSLVQKMAIVIEQFQRNCQDLTQNMSQFAAKTPGVVRQSLQQQLESVTDEIATSVTRGLGQSLADCEQRLGKAADGARNATQVLTDAFGRVETQHRHLIWKVSAVVLAALALVLGGAIWLSVHYAEVIGDNQISADLLKAYNQADVTLCGDRLCAKVGKKYVPVELR